MAFHQARKFKNARLGGLRKEIETDVFELGKKPKNGLGMKFINKAYVQYLCERGGDVIMEPFPNPTGGSEALRQIGPLLTDKVAPQSILHSDSARAVKAWVDDHPDKDLIHVCVNHAQSKHFGFVWHLYVDENDGPHFVDLTDGKFEIIRAGTQHADGFCTIVKNAFKQRGGVLRKNVKAEIKEIQYRTNTSTFNIYDNFLEAWGDLENELREEKTTIKKVKKLVEWQYQEYENALDSFPRWECPGCGFYASEEKWKTERTKHQKTCQYYKLKNSQRYEHLPSRCCCCIYSYHKKGTKMKAPNVTFFIFTNVREFLKQSCSPSVDNIYRV
jgi:hypothetical protein